MHLLGTSGTVTTLGGLHLGLARYDRRKVDGIWMNDIEVTQVIARLCGMDYKKRVANGCIGIERADLVLAGCAILDAIRRAFPLPRLRVADRGLREGMLVEMMREDGAFNGADAQKDVSPDCRA
jgi:exopolyphosphatase/guanosine-5'-triphosphate,3'-diphosphate pyrophosphatase